MTIVYILLFLVILCFFIAITVTCLNFNKSANNSGQKRDVIIVLGYPAKKDGSISPILRERINGASKLYHEGVAGTIICTGAAVANNYIEADIMARQSLSQSQIPINPSQKSTSELLQSRRMRMWLPNG
ncbi:ElyC/SanA/YdcF family protein [Desulfosporosinus sp. FKA]|uniref:YdcF family protein n=1 Tax=Desulfosporosinus sp. FKA TaxID=1969834 RepID=UPI000B498CCA|nr:ElyC/SanA/YdcF family protein [Desulfosporosinus sp. FKA]